MKLLKQLQTTLKIEGNGCAQILYSITQM